VDHRTILVLTCAAAGGSWLLLAAALAIGRVRARRRRVAETVATVDGWHLARAGRAELSEDETRTILELGMRSDEPDLRIAAITALGRLGNRHEWALDLLVEGLADGVDNPMRVVAQLDRLAPRLGRRLVPLLGHPRDVVRFAAVRLLAPYPGLATRHAPALTSDPSANVRAAALETLRAAPSSEALRCALRLLDDPHPRVRAHACSTAATIGGLAVASHLVARLADDSEWVRGAARRALALLGPEVGPAVLPLLRSGDPAVQALAALVLQDAGVLAAGADGDHVEQILAAGGERLRRAAAERARKGVGVDGARASARTAVS
jgi:HEAT repeat protein